MTTTLKTNDDNDLFIGNDGALSTASGIEAVAQQVAEVISTLRGELRYESSRGIDYDSTVFSGSPNILAFTRQARSQILALPDITDIISIEIDQNLDVLSYNARIQTTFGAETVTNGISI